VQGAIPTSPLANDAPRDLGWMLYDINYAANMTPIFFRPTLENGVIDCAKGMVAA